MKLTFIEDVNEYGEHAIRLSDFGMQQAILFRNLISKLAYMGYGELELTDFEFIEAVNCRLSLCVNDTDEGIITEDFVNFSCLLTVESYIEMMKLVEPFCIKESDAYQYLYDLDNPIDFIFSAGKAGSVSVDE